MAPELLCLRPLLATLLPCARRRRLSLVHQFRKFPVSPRRCIRLLLVLLLPPVRRLLQVRHPLPDLRERLWQHGLRFRVLQGRSQDSLLRRGRLLLVSQAVKGFRRASVSQLPARIVPALPMVCALLLRPVRVVLDNRNVREVPRRDFLNGREVLVRIRAPLVDRGRGPLAEPVYRRPSRESLFTRGNRLQRAAAR